MLQKLNKGPLNDTDTNSIFNCNWHLGENRREGKGGTESESVGVEIAVGVRERGEQRDGSATDAVMSLQSQLQLNFHLPHPFLGRKIQRGATLLRGVHHAFKYLMTI